MSVSESIALLTPFIERDTHNLPLSSFFTIPSVNGIHDADEVESHISKTSREIAAPVRDETADYRLEGIDGFTVKKFKPSVFKLGVAIAASELRKGLNFGGTPYEQATVTDRIRTRVYPKIEQIIRKVDRALEQYASQIFLGGTVSLTVDGTNEVFTENFMPPSNHFVNASISWAGATGVPFTDMSNLADVLVVDALGPVEYALMNSVGFKDMKDTTQFKNGASSQYSGEIFRLRQDREPIHPRLGGGAIFKGVLEIGAAHEIDCYVIDGWYNRLGDLAPTKYIPDNKVILKCAGQMDATFGSIVKFSTDQNAVALLSGAASGSSGYVRIPQMRFALDTNMWMSPNREVLYFGAGTRPALIPRANETYGCITTKGF